MSYSFSMSCFGCKYYKNGNCQDGKKLEQFYNELNSDFENRKGAGAIVLACQRANNIPELDKQDE